MPGKIEAPEVFGMEEEVKPPLSFTQIRVLELAALGLTNREIGKALNRSPNTISNHLSRRESDPPGIYRLLDVYSRREAVVKTIEELGVLNPVKLVSEEVLNRCKSLTDRQLEVLAWLASPELPSERSLPIEIGDKIGGLPYDTVKWYLASIYRKLGVQFRIKAISSTRAAVIYLAYKQTQETISPFHEISREPRGVGGQ